MRATIPSGRTLFMLTACKHGMSNMNRYRIVQIIIGVAAFFLIGYYFSQFLPKKLQTEYQNQSTLTFKNVTIATGLADTPSKRVQGLSGRKNLAKDTGLLFIFEKPSRDGFWMKDMNFPIDIIWFDQDQKVVTIKKNATPESYPEVFYPTAESLYVLEVPAGFVSGHNVVEGDFASFSKK